MAEAKLVKRGGSSNWYIRGRADGGRPVFHSTKTSDLPTAEALLTQYKARLLTEQVHGKVATVTFHEAAEAYIKDGGQQKYLFRERADGSVAGLIPHFRQQRLHTITQEDLDAAALLLCRPGASRETLIRNVYTPFVSVWNYASAAGRKWAVPCRWERPRKARGTAARPVSKRSGDRPVQYERAEKFVLAMSPDAAMAMTTLFYTGMRPIELYALECGDINIEGRWITIHNSKSDKPRGVPIHEFLVPLLTQMVARGGVGTSNAVFLNSKGEPYPLTNDETKGQLSSPIASARKRMARAGTPINDVSSYTGRHSVSTQLVVNGIHQYAKDQILGHGSASNTSRRYVHIPQQALIEAINTLPVLTDWSNAPWMRDPLRYAGRHFSPVTGNHAERIVALRASGITMPEIASAVGISKASVFAVLKDSGLTGTKAKRERQESAQIPLPATRRA